QIRLLHILPRGNSAIVRCSTVHVDLDHATPAFEAISYTWNGADRTHTIFVDGRPYRTTKNAHDLLLECSPVYSPRPVWIDSICINQDDAHEKSWHVQTMARIYRRACRVIVWLGTGRHANLAVQLLLELNHRVQEDGFNDKALYERYLPQRRSPRWLALGDLLEHSYFSRMWMVQETSAQSDVHVMYGGSLLLWKTLSTIYAITLTAHQLSTLVEDSAEVGMKRNGILNGHQMFAIDGVRELVLSGSGLSLQDALMRCWTLQATDPRDKVFALWDIVTDPVDPLIVPNYTKSVTQVYTDTACYLAKQGLSVLQILPCAGIGWPRLVHPLPSWAPDWSFASRSVLAERIYDKAPYSTAGALEPSGVDLVGDNALGLDAILVPGEVTDLGPEFVRPVDLAWPNLRSSPSASELPEVTSEWLRGSREAIVGWMRGQDQRYGHTGQLCDEVFWRTMMVDAGSKEMGRGVKAFARPAAPRFGTHYRYSMQELCGLEVGTAEDRAVDEQELRGLSEDDKLLLTSLWVTTVQMHCLSRRMAFTSHGYVCLVPPGTVPGDRVAIVPGLSVPVVVRPVPGSGLDRRSVDEFQLVGECYVHGIMDGEMADPERL
ncbi:heterokaryon incompatibility protein-domain-containing protein, partial [Microdochium trichocladiopsis]